MKNGKPSLYTILSPELLPLYDVSSSIVVIIDILRATSTIATALYNGATCIIPVDSVPAAIHIGKQIGGITAGERDGKKAEGLEYGNSPFEYPSSFIGGKTLILTTTNGTKLLKLALDNNARAVIAGSFNNLTAVTQFLSSRNENIILGCAAWKGRVNIEDTLFAGAVIDKLKKQVSINCDSSQIALSLYKQAEKDLYEFLKVNNASHYQRLTRFGLEKDIRYCLTRDNAPVLPIYEEGKLISL